MKTTLQIVLATLLLIGFCAPGFAAEPSAVITELGELVGKIQAKVQQGQRTPVDFADELKQFDTLLAQHKDEKTDAGAQLLFFKAKLYEEVFKDNAKASELLQQLKRDFPESSLAKMLVQQEEADKLSATLKEGNPFPGFDEKDVQGKPLSLASYKGKVVLIDFWATWCMPCMMELPNVIKTYEKHHAQGFEVIGVSLDQNKERLLAFTAEKKMAWPQFCDGQGPGNKLALKYGIHSIPATFLLDGEGKIIAKGLRGDALEEAVSKALAKK